MAYFSYSQLSSGEDSFLAATAGDVDFGTASATGLIRYYRIDKKSPLIEYMSINEGEKSQVGFKDAKWFYNWTEGGLVLKKAAGSPPPAKGNEISSGNRNIMIQREITPENRLIEFEMNGKLFSNWTENVKFTESKDKNSFEIFCSRNAAEKPASFSLKFMRWIDEDEVAFFAESSEGTFAPLKADSKITSAKIIIPFQLQGRILEISADRPMEVYLTESLPFAGGRILALGFGDAKDFNVRIDDIKNSRRYHKADLDLGVNLNNGTSFINSGSMPLIFVEALEGDARQSLAGIGNKPAISLEEKRSGDTDAISITGKISSPMTETITASNNKISYLFNGISRDNAMINMRFPYWIIGCPFEIIFPDTKKISSVNGIPLRLGIDMPLGDFPSGTSFDIWLSGTEKIVLKTDSAFSITSYRKKMSVYNDVFDSSSDDEFFANIKQKGSAHTFPPGGWILKRSQGEKKMSFDVSYVQGFKPEMPSAHKNTKTVNGLGVNLDGSMASAKSPWWEINHDKKSGGGISSISFHNASGENILSAPEKIYAVSENTEYSSVNDHNPEMFKEGNTLVVKGILTAASGKKSGIFYTSYYEYHDGYIKRKSILYSEKPVKINRMGILRLDFMPFLDECGYKPVVAAFRKAVFPGPSVAESRNFGYGFLSVYKSGGEGIDFVPGSISTQWTTQLTGDKRSKWWGVTGNSSGGASMIIEAYSNMAKPIAFKGSACFDYYIGLPELGPTLTKRYFPARFAEWYFKKKGWVDEKIIKTAAESGINLVIDGNYGVNWVGQEVPENPSAQENKTLGVFAERIGKWQQNGVAVVPFIGKGLLRNTVSGYKNKELWGQVDKDQKLPPTPWNSLMMCHNSKGFNEYYQSFLMKWRKEFNLNGFYFDFVYPQGPCFNFTHYDCEHSDADGLMDFMDWARKNIKLVYGHTGYFPTVMCENLVDLTWVGEEINYWYSTDGRIPGIDQMRQYFCHIDNTQKLVDPLIVSRWKHLPHEPLKSYLRYAGSDADEFSCRMALCGLFSEAHIQAGCPLGKDDIFSRLSPWLDMFKAFKDVDFTKFKFRDWKNQNVVLTGNANVKAAIYWNDSDAYIVVGNPESGVKQSFKLAFDRKALGWHDAASEKSEISGVLDGYKYKVYKIEAEK